MSTIKWGILGASGIARSFINGVRRTPGAGTVATVASRSPEKARAYAAEMDVPIHLGSYADLLDLSVVDVIYNPLPNSLHADWTIRALGAGLPVLCEKPFTVNAGEAEDVAAASARTGLPVAEAFMYRFHPQYEVLWKLLADGAIGDLVSVHSIFSHALDDPGIVQADPNLGGGVLMDLGAYCINVSRLVACEEPVWVSGTANRSAIDDSFWGTICFPGDLIATFEASFEANDREWVEVAGTKGRIALQRPWNGGLEAGELLLSRGGQVEKIPSPGGDPYGLEARDFATALRSGGQPTYTVEDAVANMRAIDALYESEAEDGRRVAVAEPE